ncbi:hypothetical protein [Nocardia aurea]|uniref:hypothetical protein n=1 Tax=Nocardia aurea TaxID=2144174 RepID=UPI0013003843|nr:hypothetical protein [Nocardia aurea]
MSALDPEEALVMSGAELKEIAREAFEAGSQSQIDAYWTSEWTDFDEWFDGLEWDEA